jgi:cell pole-organizing protein PopZ
MPDPTLSSDMAEQLLAPATDAAVQANMARLSAISAPGIGGLTVEGMIRDMLRPMLKDWLDENLPAMVERMVEKEIARVSRGVK